MSLNHYHPIIRGEYCFSQQVVCHDGIIRMVAIEKYVEGFLFLTSHNGGEYSDKKLYKSSLKALRGAAKATYK